MDNTHRRHDRIFSNQVRGFLQRFSRSHPRSAPNPEARRTIIGLGLLFLSLVLGWVSYSATGSNQIQEYRDHTWPELKLIQLRLADLGYTQTTEPDLIVKKLKKHPDPSPAQISGTHDFGLVYIKGHPEQPSAMLWYAPGSTPYTDWLLLGTGLAGYERLSPGLLNRPKPQRQKPKAMAITVDPKEIRY
jgi:hypothetical protein